MRLRRARLLHNRRNDEKRASLGPSIVERVNTVLRTNLLPEAFDIEKQVPFAFEWQPDLRHCTGLVAAYIDENSIQSILACCDCLMQAPICGAVGFDEYEFMGIARAGPIRLESLAPLAKAVQDTIFFWPSTGDSVVLVDYYYSSFQKGHNYSLVIQGDPLERMLSDCFDQASG